MNYKSHPVAAVLVTYNNAGVLERALSSLKWADEIVVMDRGSTDGTLEIARQFTDKVYFHPSENRAMVLNFAFQLLKSDWVLLLDPYEWVEEMLKHEIEGILLSTDQNTFGFTIPIKTMYQGKYLKSGKNTRELRLFRRLQGKAFDEIHTEAIAVPGAVARLDRAIGQEPYQNIQQLYAAIDQNSTYRAYQLLETEGTAQVNKSMPYIILRSKWAFTKRFLFQGGFQDGWEGFTFALAYAMECFLKLAKYRALTAPKLAIKR